MGGKLEIIFKPAENFNKGYFIPVLNEGAFNLSVLRPGKAVWKINTKEELMAQISMVGAG